MMFFCLDLSVVWDGNDIGQSPYVWDCVGVKRQVVYICDALYGFESNVFEMSNVYAVQYFFARLTAFVVCSGVIEM